MVINRIYIKSFGGISDREILLHPGCNVIYGENEAGKSTLLSFIRFMFYGAKLKKGNDLLGFKERYLPWDGNPMEGEIEYSIDGNVYAAVRRVGARAGRGKEITVVNKTTGEEMDQDYCKELGYRLFGMGDEAFIRTLFITANAISPDKEGELLGRLSNLADTGEEDVSYTKINGALSEEIASLTSTRRSGAVIPALQREEATLVQEMEENGQIADILEEKRNQLARAQEDYHRAGQEKKRLDEQGRNARAVLDVKGYHEAEQALEQARTALLQERESLSKIDLSPYEKIAEATPEQEQILFAGDTARENEMRTRKILLCDKRDTCRKLKVIFAIIAGAALIASCLGWWLFWLITVIMGGMFFYEIYAGEQLDKQIASIEQEENRAQQKRTEVLQTLGVVSAEEYRSLQREYNEKKSCYEKNAYRVQLCEKAFAQKKAAFEEIAKVMAERYGEEIPEVADVTLPEEGAAENAARAMVEGSARIASLEGEIVHLQEKADRFVACAERLDEVRERISEAKEREMVLQTAKEFLEQAYEELKANFAPALANKTAQLFAAVTNGKYGELLVNDEFEVKIKSDGNYRDAKFLSSGAFEQLYFSLRLGIIEIIAQNQSFPLMMDDAFITFDDQRLAQAAEFLRQYGKQVIFCTCHAREAEKIGGNTIALGKRE